MFWKLLRIENAKTFKRPFFWIGLAIVVFFVVLGEVVLYAVKDQLPGGFNAMLVWPGGLASAFADVGPSQVGGVLLIVLVGALTSQEYSWRTMQLWLSHGVPRPLLLLAKFVQSLVPMFIIVLVVGLLSGGLTAIFSLQIQGTLHTDQVDFWQLLLGVLRSTYGLFPYIALTYMLTILTRSILWSVVGGLVYVLVVETLLSALLGAFGDTGTRISAYLPTGLAYAMLNQNDAISKLPVVHSATTTGMRLGGATLPPSMMPSPLVAALCIALYTLVFCGIALWAFQRQDLTN